MSSVFASTAARAAAGEGARGGGLDSAIQAKMDALRRLQAETGAELDAMMPMMLDKAFKGEL